MSDVSHTVTDRLKLAGLRPTHQRVALANLLFGTDHRHVTAEELHQEAVSNDIRVSLATVYNTLHQFTDAGLLREVVVEQGHYYFDTNTSPHHHFYHVNSRALEDIQHGCIEITGLPDIPDGLSVASIDVIVRLKN